MTHLSQIPSHNLSVSRGDTKLRSFLPNYVSASFLGPNISKHNLSTPLGAGDRVSNPHKA